MTEFGRDDDLQGATFVRVNLTGASFSRSSLRDARVVASDLSGLVVRGSDVQNVEIDSPWLADGDFFRVNGVNVVPLVEAELDRRFPGRGLRRAEDPQGLRSAWAALQQTWAVTLHRADSMPEGTVDASVDGEWSLAQTLRHLVMATDTWLGRAVLRLEQPYHPLGLANEGAAEDGLDMSLFTTGSPTYAEVLAARQDRTTMVADFIDQVTPDILQEARANPWAPQYPETVRSCLHTILEEEWEHHRYAVRDLDALEQAAASG
ncbi:DinB family protein [Ornithinimicrobium sp. F0845]|uniref:DinB family protein n=1 Tax=Ornithinimicrobium sp. F0845 TaxID=2926412 RepID=UPI001FF304AE|nr:DinB family protein [Ornithinimicrobium sp. F0845]MCK0112204.1 DinB family protein [Ornithinimicrobium sp. F0845]